MKLKKRFEKDMTVKATQFVNCLSQMAINSELDESSLFFYG